MQIPLSNLAPPNAIMGGLRETNMETSRETKRETNKRDGSESTMEFKSIVDMKNKSTSTRSLKHDGANENNELNSQSSSGSRSNSSLGSSSEDNHIFKKSHNTKNKESKNNVVSKLMASLESELGITADRFSAVLAQLPSEVKEMSVVESAPYVIKELGIQELDQNAATESYLNLLSRFGINNENDSAQENNTTLFEQNTGPMSNLNNIENEQTLKTDPSSVSSKSVTRRKKLNETIDELNKKFFDVQSKKSENSSTSKLSDSALSNSKILNKSEFANNSDFIQNQNNKNDLYLNLNGNSNDYFRDNPIKDGVINDISEPPIPTLKLFNESESRRIDNIVDFSKEMPIETKSSLGEARINSQPTLNEFEAYLSSGNPNFEFNKVGGKELKESPRMWSVEELPYLTQAGDLGPVSSTFEAKGNNEFNQDLNNHSLSKSTLFNAEKKSKESDKDSIEQLLNEFNVSTEQESKSQPSVSMGSRASLSQDGITSPQARINNIEKLSSATESLAARGGGEVKIVLAPEGLGSIQLRVSVVEGRVQVEMKAENKESQKMLESSLADLRHNLASHNLAVDSVKVDIGQHFSQRDESQNFSQPQQDFGRDQAKQFMNQFREENAFQKQSFFEAPGFKSYRSQNEELLAPISQEIRPRSSLNRNKGRDLNVVV